MLTQQTWKKTHTHTQNPPRHSVKYEAQLLQTKRSAGCVQPLQYLLWPAGVSSVHRGRDLRQLGAARRSSSLSPLVQIAVSKIASSVQHALLCKKRGTAPRRGHTQSPTDTPTTHQHACESRGMYLLCCFSFQQLLRRLEM